MTTLQLPDPESFYQTVWDIVRQIPRGRAATYGQIASMIPAPDGIAEADYARLGPRWVGDAMNAVSRVDEQTVPWHRVINRAGGISLPEGSKSALLQKARLEVEGMSLDAKGHVDLNKFGWEGPDEAWLNARGLLPPRQVKKPPTDSPTQLQLF